MRRSFKVVASAFAAAALLGVAACSGDATPAPGGSESAPPAGGEKYAIVLKVRRKGDTMLVVVRD